MTCAVASDKRELKLHARIKSVAKFASLLGYNYFLRITLMHGKFESEIHGSPVCRCCWCPLQRLTDNPAENVPQRKCTTKKDLYLCRTKILGLARIWPLQSFGSHLKSFQALYIGDIPYTLSFWWSHSSPIVPSMCHFGSCTAFSTLCVPYAMQKSSLRFTYSLASCWWLPCLSISARHPSSLPEYLIHCCNHSKGFGFSFRIYYILAGLSFGSKV